MTYAIPHPTNPSTPAWATALTPIGDNLDPADRRRARTVGVAPWDFVEIEGDLISIDVPPLW